MKSNAKIKHAKIKHAKPSERRGIYHEDTEVPDYGT